MKTTFRILAFLMAALLLSLSFTACGDKEEESETDATTGGNQMEIVIDNKKAYAFAANGVTFTVGNSADILNRIGSWKSMNSSDACGGFSGKDYIYYYEGFSIYTTPDKSGNVINMIELTSDQAKLPNGLTIGSTRKDVVDAMGSEGTAQGESLVYTSGTVKLTFIMRDDSVTNVQYTLA